MYEDYARIRDARGLKDSDVCKGAGIPHGTMSDWKKGRYNLKTDKLVKIAEFLGVPVEALLGVQNKGLDERYYLNDDAAAFAQAVFEKPGLRILLDAAKDIREDRIKLLADMALQFKETNPDG